MLQQPPCPAGPRVVVSTVLLGSLVGGAYSVLVGIVFIYVGHRLTSRRLTGDADVANRLFVLWWQSLGATSVVGGLFSVAAAWNLTDLALHVVLLNVSLLVICLALWGLGYYLIYLFTGRRAFLLPLAVFYALEYFFLLYLTVQAEPNGVVVEQWGARLTYAHEVPQTPLIRTTLFLLIGPPVLGALAYISLLFRVRTPVLRYRIGLVAGSIIVWFGSSVLAGIMRIDGQLVSQTRWWPPVSRLVSLLAALIILLAYQPPATVAVWLARREPASAQAGAD